MDFKVLIADSALADLKEIVEFVAEDNREAAIRLGEKLVAHALSLATMPRRFPFHDKRRGIRKMPLPPFLIFYVCDERASVVNILHFWQGGPGAHQIFQREPRSIRFRQGNGDLSWTRRSEVHHGESVLGGSEDR